VRRRRHRNEIALGIQSGLVQDTRDVREVAWLDGAHVEQDHVSSAALELFVNCAGDDVARRELLDEPVSILGEEQRSFASDSFADEKSVEQAIRNERGGVELKQFEIGQLGTGFVRQKESAPDRAARIRGSLPKCRGATRCEESGSGRHVAHIRCDTGAATVGDEQAERRAALVHAYSLVAEGCL